MLPSHRTLNGFLLLNAFVVFLVLAVASPVRAQVNTVTYSTSGPGVSRAITNWGFVLPVAKMIWYLLL